MPRSLPLTALAKASLTAALTLLLAACQPVATAEEPPEIITRWDHRPEATEWNAAMVEALLDNGQAMLSTTPRDADDFCPGFEEADAEGRAAFWVAFFSGLARYESGWRPEAAGAGGRYQGLLQILPATARFNDCDIDNPRGLYDGATNLACATRIAARAVGRDNVIATGRGGVASDWPPLRNPRKRAEIATFTRALPVCQG